MCSEMEQRLFVPGELCITQEQTQELVTNAVGSWGLVLGTYIYMYLLINYNLHSVNI